MSAFGSIAGGLLSGAGSGMVGAADINAAKEIEEAKQQKAIALENLRSKNDIIGRQFTADENAKAQTTKNIHDQGVRDQQNAFNVEEHNRQQGIRADETADTRAYNERIAGEKRGLLETAVNQKGTSDLIKQLSELKEKYTKQWKDGSAQQVNEDTGVVTSKASPEVLQYIQRELQGIDDQLYRLNGGTDETRYASVVKTSGLSPEAISKIDKTQYTDAEITEMAETFDDEKTQKVLAGIKGLGKADVFDAVVNKRKEILSKQDIGFSVGVKIGEDNTPPDILNGLNWLGNNITAIPRAAASDLMRLNKNLVDKANSY